MEDFDLAPRAVETYISSREQNETRRRVRAPYQQEESIPSAGKSPQHGNPIPEEGGEEDSAEEEKEDEERGRMIPSSFEVARCLLPWMT
jgi:hypothetical protein